eukprot:UN1562
MQQGQVTTPGAPMRCAHGAGDTGVLQPSRLRCQVKARLKLQEAFPPLLPVWRISSETGRKQLRCDWRDKLRHVTLEPLAALRARASHQAAGAAGLAVHVLEDNALVGRDLDLLLYRLRGVPLIAEGAAVHLLPFLDHIAVAVNPRVSAALAANDTML